MPARPASSLLRAGSALALTLIIAGCTPGGQFDPTEMLSSDIFNTKKTIPGQREPLFPNGVPGVENGVPPDLVKGYVPPPGPANTGDAAVGPAANAAVNPAAKTAAAEPEPKPKPKKPKPKPKIARAPAAPAHDAAFDRRPAPAAAPAGQSNWPNQPSSGQSQAPAQAGQTNWPAPSPANQVQTNWPAPPPANQVQTNWPPPPSTGQAQQSAQPGQSIWPNPPSTH
jgi:hypothetical protein